MKNKIKILTNILEILKNKKHVKLKNNIYINNPQEQGLLHQLNTINKNLQDVKYDEIDISDKTYISNLKNISQKNNKCKKSHKDLNKLYKITKCNDFHGCENFIEEKIFFEK